jgi:methylmalonyl-CoA mutase C-terminal domain/subunit
MAENGRRMTAWDSRDRFAARAAVRPIAIPGAARLDGGNPAIAIGAAITGALVVFAVSLGSRAFSRVVAWRRRLGACRRGAPKTSEGSASPAWHNRPMTDRPIKVLIAKPGLDGHDRGAKVLARGLRDEGFEVVYTGLRQTPEMIATAALQEDVDVVGLSILSGAHMTLLPRITKLLREEGLDDVLVTAGGIIPDDDVAALAEVGVARVFGPGTTIAEVAAYLRTNARPRD